MAIRFFVSASDPDLENLLLHLDKLTHLDIHQKIQLVGNAREWLEMSRSSTVKAQDFGASVSLCIDDKPLFRELHCQSSQTPQQLAQASQVAEVR